MSLCSALLKDATFKVGFERWPFQAKGEITMETTKYIGMDVHTEAISVAVRNSAGKVVMESILETKANTILEFIEGLHGNVHVTFAEGTWAATLYDLLKPHVTKVGV